MADYIRPTPESSPLAAALSRALRKADEFARKPFGYDNPPVAALSDLVGVPAVYRTLERVGYGEPLTTGKGMTLKPLDDTTEFVLNAAGPLAKAASVTGRGARSAGRLAGEALDRAMIEGTGPLARVLPEAVRPLAVVKHEKGGNWQSGAANPAQAVRRLAINPESFSGDLINEAAGRPLWEQITQEYPYASYEDSLRWLQQNSPETLEKMIEPHDAAINKWLGSKLARYMRNDMATAEDPIRALAERNILHVDPSELNVDAEIYRSMNKDDPTVRLMANSPAARSWEGASDLSVAPTDAKFLKSFGLKGDAWIKDLPDETMVYGLTNPRHVTNDLRFDHLRDELRNAVRPDSDLPDALRIDPRKLDKVTVPQAVELVSKINAWREEQKVAANAALANNAATQTFKAYPDKGYRWVELKSADNDRAALRKALEYEGNEMGHCVGGYCDDVATGKARIYSLRDQKGRPHVTIEVQPGALSYEQMQEVARRANEDANAQMFKTFEERDKYYDARRNQLLDEAQASAPQVINQIKGKGNAAPKDEYLPFVRDFVANNKWSRINDAQNAGLRRYSAVFNDNEQRMIESRGGVVPEHEWLNGEEIQALHNLIAPAGKRLKYDDRGRVVGSESDNYARGGAVVRDAQDTYNPATIAALAAELGRELQ